MATSIQQQQRQKIKMKITRKQLRRLIMESTDGTVMTPDGCGGMKLDTQATKKLRDEMKANGIALQDIDHDAISAMGKCNSNMSRNEVIGLIEKVRDPAVKEILRYLLRDQSGPMPL